MVHIYWDFIYIDDCHSEGFWVTERILQIFFIGFLNQIYPVTDIFCRKVPGSPKNTGVLGSVK